MTKPADSRPPSPIPACLIFLLGMGALRADCIDGLLPSTYQCEAVATGNWKSINTWKNGRIPAANDTVLIGDGVKVNIGTPVGIPIKTLVINGTVTFNRNGGTTGQLEVDTILIPSTGTLEMGTVQSPLTGTAGITFTNNNTASPVNDANRCRRGLLAEGSVQICGASKTPYATLQGGALKNSTVITLDAIPTDWQVGDQLVIPGTTFSRTSNLENEKFSITALNRNTGNITLSGSLQHHHLRTYTSKLLGYGNYPAVKIHVANLTRNINIQSAGTATAHRGHVMLETNNCSIKNARFYRLGRTDKLLPVTDPALGGTASKANPRGRYALHFHEAGCTAAAMARGEAVVYGCVVEDTVGWGFVNHQSYVHFENNVCYNFVGSGFITENGNEAGEFIGNLALHGIGDGQFPARRILFANPPRRDVGDMGFNGEGFWFTAPDVEVRKNIAAGCKGSGFVYWCAGRYDPVLRHFIGFPMDRVPSIFGNVNSVRKWNNGAGALVIDIPIRIFSDNTAYACFTGLKMRWVNTIANKMYETTAGGQLDYSGTAARVVRTMERNLFWNTLNGIHATYVSNITFKNNKISCNNNGNDHGGVAVDAEQVASNIHFDIFESNNYLTGICLGSAGVTYNQATTEIQGFRTGSPAQDFYTGAEPLQVDGGAAGYIEKDQDLGNTH